MRLPLLLVTFVLFPVSLFGSPDTFAVEAEWNTYFQEGLFNEIVYDYHSSVGEYKLSHLYWEMKNLITAGPAITLKWHRLQVELSYLFPVTEGRGNMYDYDWLGKTTGYMVLGVGVSEDEWTHYSKSKVAIERYRQLDTALIWNFYKNSLIHINSGFELDYLSIRWEDTPISYIYSTPTADGYKANEGTFTASNAINYDFYSLSPNYSIQMLLTLPAGFLLRAKAAYSPFSWRETWDEHMLNNNGAGTAYNDIFHFTHQLQTSLAVEKALCNTYSFGFSGTLFNHFHARGDTEIWSIDKSTLYSETENTSGSNAWYLQIGFSAAYIY